jgi:hypothetical protein
MNRRFEANKKALIHGDVMRMNEMKVTVLMLSAVGN